MGKSKLNDRLLLISLLYHVNTFAWRVIMIGGNGPEEVNPRRSSCVRFMGRRMPSP